MQRLYLIPLLKVVILLFLFQIYLYQLQGIYVFSDRALSKCTSIFPVPLNSSNITSSILLPVSTNAVASIVKLPASSVFLAAPKNLFGLCSAAGSKPPDSVLPDAGTTKL